MQEVEFTQATYSKEDLVLLAECLECNGGSLSKGLLVFQSVRSPTVNDNQLVHMWLEFAESIQKDRNFVNDHFNKFAEHTYEQT